MEDRRQIKVNFWVGWTLANMIGVAGGWALGEYVSHLAPKLTWIAFTIPIWIMRWAVLQRLNLPNAFKAFDYFIWFGGELMGSFMGLGIKENDINWATGGPIFGLMTGAGLWFMWWSVSHAKRGRYWIISAFGWGMLGIILGSILTSLGLTFATELGEVVGTLSPFIGWVVAGATLGGFVGGITGLAIIGSTQRLFPPPTNFQ